MKIVRLLLAALVCISIGHINRVAAQEVNISIDQIKANELVSGYVSGLAASEYSKYKVLLYAHTDQWYIHPFAGQDEGMSWAAVQSNGAWQIKTVQRDFKSNSVAALLVEKSYPEPNKIEDLKMIPNRAIVVKDLPRNSPDFGKL